VLLRLLYLIFQQVLGLTLLMSRTSSVKDVELLVRGQWNEALTTSADREHPQAAHRRGAAHERVPDHDQLHHHRPRPVRCGRGGRRGLRRALAYVTRELLGDGFGTVYDISSTAVSILVTILFWADVNACSGPTSTPKPGRTPFDEPGARFILGCVNEGALHVIANKRQSGDLAEYRDKELEQRSLNPSLDSCPIVFLEIEVGHPSDFAHELQVPGWRSRATGCCAPAARPCPTPATSSARPSRPPLLCPSLHRLGAVHSAPRSEVSRRRGRRGAGRAVG
jgi:hypothetical protein